MSSPSWEPGLEPGIREGDGVRAGRATVARFSEAIAKTRASGTVRLVRRKCRAQPTQPKGENTGGALGRRHIITYEVPTQRPASLLSLSKGSNQWPDGQDPGVATETLVPGTVYFLSAEERGFGGFVQAEKSKLSAEEPTPQPAGFRPAARFRRAIANV